MQNIFNSDNKVIRFGNYVTDLMVLQFITIVFSIPIVTVGPAFTAMHSVLLKLYRRQEPSVIRSFWSAFKSNFRQSTLIWLFYLGFFLFLCADLYFFVASEDLYLRLAIFALPIPALLGLMSLCWVFVLQSRYQNTIWQTIKHALTMCFRYPLKTLSMVVLMTFPVWVSFLSQHTYPFLILMGFSVPGFLRTIVYSQIFDSLEGTDWRKELRTED